MELSADTPKENKGLKAGMQIKSIKGMIILGFIVAFLAIVGMSLFNLSSTKSMNGRISKMVEKEQPLLVADFQLANNMATRTGYLQDYIFTGNSHSLEKFTAGRDEGMQLEEYISKHTTLSWVQETLDKKVQWGQLTDKAIKLVETKKLDEAKQLMNKEIQPVSMELIDSLTELADKRTDETKQDGEATLKMAKTNNIMLFSISLVATILLLVIPYVMVKAIARHINPINERLRTVAAGDFSQEPLETVLTDELGQMVYSTNSMSDSLREMIQSIGSMAEMTSSHSEELTQSANEVKNGSEQIATTMQELASGSETQAESASDLAGLMISFVEKVQDADGAGSKAQQSTEGILKMSSKGESLMGSSSDQMNRIDEIVKSSVDKMSSLNHEVQEISNLVVVIKDVADQTNLLALNAAIEAARAGEHGKGFAVVADEVRKLAEQTAHSIIDITTFVDAIQKETKRVSDSLEKGYEEVAEGTRQIHETKETFNQINQAIQGMTTNINHISLNLTDITKSSQVMNESIDEIASVSEESAASVEETSASSQEITGSMEEVAGSAAQLAQVAENLNALIQNIKV